MAITEKGVRDNATALRFVLAFIVLGAALGGWGGYHYEVDKLGESGAALAPHFLIGVLAEWLGLLDIGWVRDSALMHNYLMVSERFPAVADQLRGLAVRVLVFPWAALGAVNGFIFLHVVTRPGGFFKKEVDQ